MQIDENANWICFLFDVDSYHWISLKFWRFCLRWNAFRLPQCSNLRENGLEFSNLHLTNEQIKTLIKHNKIIPNFKHYWRSSFAIDVLKLWRNRWIFATRYLLERFSYQTDVFLINPLEGSSFVVMQVLRKARTF